MHLDKYYLDVVSPDGSGWIGYAACLEGLGVTVAAASTLRWDAAPLPTVTSRRTLRGTLPASNDQGLDWHCGPLELSGWWESPGSGVGPQTLWADEEGFLRWEALAPFARVNLSLGRDTITGWGYAERLQLNVVPWRLPITTLRWGRFVAPGTSVIWIGWAHAPPRHWLWHNGAAHHSFALDATTLSWPGGTLLLGPARTLRAGRLGDTVFARWPHLQPSVPARILAWRETKWCRLATLVAPGRPTTTGWVIHEDVCFQ